MSKSKGLVAGAGWPNTRDHIDVLFYLTASAQYPFCLLLLVSPTDVTTPVEKFSRDNFMRASILSEQISFAVWTESTFEKHNPPPPRYFFLLFLLCLLNLSVNP